MTLRAVSIRGYACLVGGDGPALAILPGLTPEPGLGSASTRATHRVTARAWSRTRRVYYINRRPGMPPGTTLADVAAEHADVLKEAFDGPVDVLGISTGGSVAQQLAAEHPEVVRSLALISTACRLGPLARQVQRRVAARIRSGALREACAVYAADLAPPGPLELPAAAAGWLLGPRIISVASLPDLATIIEAEDPFDLAELPTIEAPTLLLGGGNDRYYPAALFEETARLIPGARLRIFPHDGHVSLMSNRLAVAEVLSFLEDAAVKLTL